jgi:hypothetical protein
MHPGGATRRVGLVRATRIILLELVARSIILSFCLENDDMIVDDVINGLQRSTGHLHGKQDGSVLAALYLEKECSNELWECQEPGALPDRANYRCFSICISVGTGCRGCCPDNTCYQPAGEPGSLGTCVQCPDDGDSEGCGLADTDIRMVIDFSITNRSCSGSCKLQ